jgi:hypothetical protein
MLWRSRLSFGDAVKQLLPFVALALASATIVAAQAPAQPDATPFGLHMGMTVDQLTAAVGPLSSEKTDLVKVQKVPTPHPTFTSYYVAFTKTHGLCAINAVSGPIEINAFGDQLKSSIDQVVEQLSGRYGNAQKVDFLKAGSIWNRPQDWSAGLLKEERVYGFDWREPSNAASLYRIDLQGEAVSLSVAAIRLSFRAKNYEPCIAERRKATASAF